MLHRRHFVVAPENSFVFVCAPGGFLHAWTLYIRVLCTMLIQYYGRKKNLREILKNVYTVYTWRKIGPDF